VVLSKEDKLLLIKAAHNLLEGHHGISRGDQILSKDVTEFISKCVVLEKFGRPFGNLLYFIRRFR
jgi:hypothetical protein